MIRIRDYCKIALKKILPRKFVYLISHKKYKSEIRLYRQHNIDKENINGINIVGLFSSSIGLGQVARLIEEAISVSRIPFSRNIVHYDNGAIQLSDEKESALNSFEYNCNLDIFNPDLLFKVRDYADPQNWKNKYNIGFWVWEMDRIPYNWIKAAEYYDEIWVPSSFVQNILAKYRIKSHVIPYPLNVKTDKKIDLEKYGVTSSDIIILTMFDLLSYIDRKNPRDAIDAFLKSQSSSNPNVKLLIKVNNSQARKSEFSELKKWTQKYSNIIIIDETFGKDEIIPFINSADVILSLHRCEGFGLILAEAMQLGKLCIATAWSGNLEFMSDENSLLVKYKLIKLKKRIGIYEKNMRWAQPDLEHAAARIDAFVADPSSFEKILHLAEESVKKKLGFNNVISIIEKRLLNDQWMKGAGD